MTGSDLGWELWRSFLAVTETGSLSAAARSLRLTQPTLGRHVDALEEALGEPLFVRSQHGLQPTALALSLVPHAEAMAAAAESLLRTASGEAEGERGTVRLAASEIVGIEVLPAMLARFREAHPGIVLELALSNRNEDLLRRDADIAVRMVRPQQAALVARRIGAIGIGLYAKRDYLARHGNPSGVGELSAHTVIGVDRNNAALEAIRIGGEPVLRELFSYRCDSDVGQLAAVRAGVGIGICQHGVAARDPDLVPVLPDLFDLSLDMWLAMHEDLRYSRRVRLLFDHLAAELGAYAKVGRRQS
nr:LysR family transcriptional regulator [Mesorhizobium sp.]